MPRPTRILLLIEDNPGDAELVKELLAQPDAEEYRVLHVARLEAGVQQLKTADVDVIVLDLRLPDCSGVESVRRMRKMAGETPIVVLTGSDDEELALACIRVGAQDYLCKQEARPQNLRRAVGYAITRKRESQLRELEEMLSHYRALGSGAVGTSVTADMAGTGALSVRAPERFRAIASEYFDLLQPFLARDAGRLHVRHDRLARIATLLGDCGAGPRDLLDIHLKALDEVLALSSDPHAHGLVLEGRLLALEMMGLLVDYYRVGARRRFAEGLPS